MTEVRTDFDQIIDQHKELRTMMKDLKDYLRQPRPEIGQDGFHTWAFGLTERLTRFHDKLFRHFREEDRSGFLEEMELEHPRATHIISALRKDHDRILCDIRAILTATLAYGEGKQPENPALRKWTQSVLDQLARHETEETELLQKVHLEDLGCGD